MRSERWQRLDALVASALELPVEEREPFLDRACADDPSLRREAESLLAVDEQAEGFLEETVLREPASIADVAAVGERIGSYRIERKIGSGGMGVVYLAQRADEAYQGRVAIKLLQQGRLQAADVVQRFHRERQILASLDHPSIARLLDGGTTEDGRPYLVMEHIDGQPIDAYCDAERLTIRQRLELFREVCVAVHTAHQNLVVHRDLKPSNILITTAGSPRLLDFGIAKLLDPERFAISAEATLTGLRPMTPDYASPEQIRGEAITTASDVYSLGVLLYRLLTGRPPHVLTGLSPGQLDRVLSEEPPRASSTVDAKAKGGGSPEDAEIPGSEELSTLRGCRPAQLRRQLTGDLDHIVAKALRREPSGRYGSVEQLSEDLRRHLEGLAVLARQDALGYQVRTLLRRHRWAVGVVGLILALVVSFAVAMAGQAAKTARQRDLAELERDRAQQQRGRAERVSDFMVNIFRGVDPWIASGDEVTARQVLESGVAKIYRELQEEPEIRASLQDAIGTVYLHLARYDEAVQLLESALATREATLGASHPDVALSLAHLANAVKRQGRYEAAEELYHRALGIRENGPDPEGPAVAEIWRAFANVYRLQGRFEEAETAGERALELYREALGPDHIEVAMTLNALAGAAARQGRQEEAQRLLEETLAIHQKAVGEVHVGTASILYNLGNMRMQLGDPDDAKLYLERALAAFSKLYDKQHPKIAAAHLALAEVADAGKQVEQEEEHLQTALTIYEATVGPEHDLAAMGRYRLGVFALRQGRLAEARPLLERALELRQRSFGPKHPLVAESLLSVAELRKRQGQTGRVEALCGRVRPIWEEHPGHPGLSRLSKVCQVGEPESAR